MARSRTLVIAAFATWLLCLPVAISYANCDDKRVYKATTLHLGDYSYETASFRSLSGFGNTKNIDAVFIAYGNEKYRVLNLCYGHKGEVTFQVLDSKRNVIFTNEHSSVGDKFDFTAPATGDYVIRFKYNAEAGDGCVAFAIGYK